MSLGFANDKANRSEFRDENPYMRAFLGDLCLRPSCYQCPLKEGREGADITLADCWGIQNVAPEMNDDIGISSVMSHSDAGRRLLQRVDPYIVSRQVTFRESLSGNGTYINCPKCPDGRDYFMSHFRRKSMRALCDYLLEGPWYVRHPTRFLGHLRCILGNARRRIFHNVK